MRSREIVRLAQENVKRHEQLLRQVVDRQATGADSMVDVSQARSRLARAQSQQADAMDFLQTIEAMYFRLTNRTVIAYRMMPVPDPSFPYKYSEDGFNVARDNEQRDLG